MGRLRKAELARLLVWTTAACASGDRRMQLSTSVATSSVTRTTREVEWCSPNDAIGIGRKGGRVPGQLTPSGKRRTHRQLRLVQFHRAKVVSHLYLCFLFRIELQDTIAGGQFGGMMGLGV